MTTSVTRLRFTTQHQTCKTKTKTDFLVSDRGLVLRPAVSDHITSLISVNVNISVNVSMCIIVNSQQAA